MSDAAPAAQPSKSALKKAAKAAEKAKRKAEIAAAEAAKKGAANSEDFSHLFAALPVHQSSEKDKKDRAFTSIDEVKAGGADDKANHVLIRARVFSSRAAGNLCFLVLRQQYSTIQAVVAKGDTVPKPMVKFAAGILPESIVDVLGYVVTPEEPITSCTRQDVEVQVRGIFVVSAAQPVPIQLGDASLPEQELDQADSDLAAAEAKDTPDEAELERLRGLVSRRVPLATRFDHRPVDLRTPANHAIFRLQSAVCQLFRERLLARGFTEIHSPKLLGAASEGGAEVFEVKYFNRKAYLAQSPQFFKQMAIAGDFGKVFEIAPVFRAENSQTPRHMTEFVGLDLEMEIKEHYHEAMDELDGVFQHIFTGLEERFAKELAVVRRYFDTPKLTFKWPSPVIQFPEAVEMLKAAGAEQDPLGDMSTPNEKLLGKLVKEKYGTDFYRLDKFPLEARAFYSMADPKMPGYSNSYDFMLNCQEVLSGAQRINDYDMLKAAAERKGVDAASVAGYLDAFKYGCPPHAGGGVGMERVLAFYLGLTSVQQTSLFCRTPTRLAP